MAVDDGTSAPSGTPCRASTRATRRATVASNGPRSGGRGCRAAETLTRPSSSLLNTPSITIAWIQEVLERLLDETRQPLALTPAGRLGAEGLVVIADQLLQGALLGLPGPIRDSRESHGPPHRKARASTPDCLAVNGLPS